MRSILFKIILLIQDGATKELAIAAYLFSKRVLALVRGSGLLFTALYLKQAASSLQVAYGGIKRPHDLLPVPVSLTRSGYPTIIPAFHRKMMRKHDDKADMLVRLYLSFFTINRILKLAKKIDADLFKSIVEPAPLDSVLETVGYIKIVLPQLVERYLPKISVIPLHRGIDWDPTWKTLTVCCGRSGQPTYERSEFAWPDIQYISR